MREKKWDKYEVALLIEAFLAIEEGADKLTIMQTLSKNLRKMAQNEGFDIDDTFRNLNGIQWQLGFIKLAFNNDVFESRQPPKIFIEGVKTYKEHMEDYYAILEEAYGKIGQGAKDMTAEENKQNFIKWFKLFDGKKCTVESFIDYFEKTSEYAKKYNISKKVFWEIDDVKYFNSVRTNLSGNKVFKFKHPKLFSFFEKWGKIYSIYLKDNIQEERVSISHQIEQRVNTDTKTYIYHIKFGFGVVIASKETLFDVVFDGVNVPKTLAKGHPAIFYISEEDYGTKRVPKELELKQEKAAEVVEPTNRSIAKESRVIVDFSKPGDYSFTVPFSVKYFGDVKPVKSWKEVYTVVLSFLFEDYSDVFNKNIGRSLIGANRIDIGTKSEQMVSPRSIGGGLCVETNLSAKDIVKRIKILLDLCNVDYVNLVIEYSQNNQTQEDKVYVVIENKPEDDGDKFGDWLCNVQHMSVSSSRSYFASLKTANEFALKHNIWKKSIFAIEDKEEMVGAINCLLNDEFFSIYNSDQHNRFSAALKKYIAFRFGEDSLSLITFGRGIKNPKEKKEEPITSMYSGGILSLLEGHYRYGFRINSPIEIMRIRNFASNEGIALPDDDEQLKAEISSVGFAIEDKIYVFGKEIIEELENRINAIFEKGFNLIFFDVYMEKDEEWLSENHIFTVELLKELLVKTNLNLFYGKNFISAKGKVTEVGGITEEIKAIWGEGVLLTNKEMEDRLPYIPDDRIRRALSAAEEMVWVSNDTYTYLDKVIISAEDAENIIEYVDESCSKKGYASISDVPLKNVIEENYELSITAIYEAVFNKILKDKFFINGKIITRTATGLDAVTLVKAYCEDKEECTFEELYNKVIELTGASNRQIAFEAGYGVMVRVGENRFVAEKYVNFDVAYIDSLLEEIITAGFTAIKDITTFARFSICGQEWNHYLLESYCYRFSKVFTLNVINFNDKNSGIISKKTLGLSYKEMLARVLVKSKIDLVESVALQYLYDNGYLAKRQYGAISDVLRIAEGLR